MGIKRTISIRRIDLWGNEPLESKKMKQKMQKTEISIFPMYFWANSFVKKNRKGRQQGVHQFENQSYLCVQYIKQFHFFTTPFLFLKIFKYHLRMTRPNDISSDDDIVQIFLSLRTSPKQSLGRVASDLIVIRRIHNNNKSENLSDISI